MTDTDINEKIRLDECQGEKIINWIRFSLAVIYVASTSLISIIRSMSGYEHIPLRAHLFTSIFLAYSIVLFFYLRNRKTIPFAYKYLCVVLDSLILSASIWVSCTYIENSPPVAFLSIRALFFSILIMAGSLRHSVNCSFFSGAFMGVCYITVVIINRHAIDLPYFFILENKTIDVTFPFYYEIFRSIGMIIVGIITGVASRRHLKLFVSIIKTQAAVAGTASTTVEKTRDMAKTIRKSTDEIFLSSKNIFSTANNQAASVQEIESTINENTQIAVEIAEKTSSVASIATKMENDVNLGFSVLKRNVDQLENIKSKNNGVITGIISLGNKIIRIRDIIKTINTITDQTKVIAFNAALEAASAGDRGKRFSVVASEVNRLADDIAVLTRQIREQVEEIQNSSSSLIISSEESADKINEGNNLIKELEDIFREIRSGAEITANQAQTITVSTQKQQKSTEQINIAIADISKGLSNFIQSTKIATSSAEGLTEMIGDLNAILAVSKNGESNSGYASLDGNDTE